MISLESHILLCQWCTLKVVVLIRSPHIAKIIYAKMCLLFLHGWMAWHPSLQIDEYFILSRPIFITFYVIVLKANIELSNHVMDKICFSEGVKQTFLRCKHSLLTLDTYLLSSTVHIYRRSWTDWYKCNIILFLFITKKKNAFINFKSR